MRFRKLISGKLRREQVIESTLNIREWPYVVRVWRSEERVQPSYDNGDLLNKIHLWLASKVTFTSLALLIANESRVAAVEVQVEPDPYGRTDGIVIYNDWP